MSSERNNTVACLIKILILPLSHHKGKDLSGEDHKKWQTTEMLKMALQGINCHTVQVRALSPGTDFHKLWGKRSSSSV